MNITQNFTEISGARDSRVRQQCEAAQQLANGGDYDGARAELSGVWSVIGTRPSTEKLAPDTKAEILLRVGAIAGWLGSAQQIGGAQEFAKDLLAESRRLFEEIGDHEKVVEAQTDLAICYWREGAFDESRVLFADALSHARSPGNKFRVLINSTIAEISSGRYPKALAALHQAQPLLEHADDAAKGRYYTQLALVHRGLNDLDAALIDYSAASYHLGLVGHVRYLANVENNFGFILLQLERHSEALTHLDSARRVFVSLKDAGHVAQVNELRAQAFIAMQRYDEAERAAFAAVSTLDRGDEQALLADALITFGRALAGLGKWEAAQDAFLRAAEALTSTGDLPAAGNVYLIMIEELKSGLAPGEAKRFLIEADDRLGHEVGAETAARLRRCMRIAVSSLREYNTGIEGSLIGGSLEEEMNHFEAHLIKRALDQTNGSVTSAARLLGLTHQGLAWTINTRHKHLLHSRTPVRKRRKSIIKKR